MQVSGLHGLHALNIHISLLAVLTALINTLFLNCFLFSISKSVMPVKEEKTITENIKSYKRDACKDSYCFL